MNNIRILAGSILIGLVVVVLAAGAWQLARRPAASDVFTPAVQASAQPAAADQGSASSDNPSLPTALTQGEVEQPAVTGALRPSATPKATESSQYRIITVLPRDAIQAIDKPEFYPVAEADLEYAPEELVLGVSLGGESRAYSTVLLDRHEIVNDTVGGRKIAVTW
jgi:hypothetical protein